jgi:hypothetical protein
MSSNNQEMGLDEFLGHKSSDYASKGGFLENWKKRKPPMIDTWIHTRSKIASLWQHGQPRIMEFADKETKAKKQMIFGGQWPCWESEDVLIKQRHRDEETGRRMKPPVICPECLMAEWVREQIESGELDWVKPMFRYEAKDADEPVIIRAGGMIGLFNKKTMSDKELEQLKKGKVNRREAWKENQIAKLSYVFSVVDNDKPATGCCIATEPNLLGDKIKEVIQKAIMDAEDEGNPFKHPYCIRWMHRPDEQEFSKKYDAARISKIKMTDEIRKLIIEDDPPNLTRTLARKNPIALRAMMEDACLIKGVPWDEIFGRACKAWEDKEGKEGSKSDGTNFDPEELEEGTPARAAAVKRESKVLAKILNEPDDDTICEECGDVIPTGKQRCPACGAKVSVKGAADDCPLDDPTDDLPFG